STWLWRVTVNLCLDARRRPSHAPLDDIAEPPDPAPSADVALAAAQADRRVSAAVAALPDRPRAAVALGYGAGPSNPAAADAPGISLGALEQLLVRARRALRERLQDDEDLLS